MYILADFEIMTKKALKDLLIEASDSYYNKAESIMSDEEFDMGFKYFTVTYPKDDLVKKIGAKIKTSEWKKALHKIRMCSLNKAQTTDEFRKWAMSILDKFYVIMDKLDGISIDLEYENGELVKAITRGDGVEGEDIYKNVINMKNVKMTIPGFTGSIRGEIVMFVTDFERLNVILKSRGEKEHSNPRNTAAGVAKRFDGTNTEFLTVLYYDATGKWESEEQKLNWLNSQGLKTCFWTKCDIHHCESYYNEYEKHLRAETPYDIDGLVVKANSIALQDRLGLLGENPKAQVAWKFTSMKAETEVEGIEWSHGQNMRITPVALLKPVKIGGVIVKRASLHNMEMFYRLDLGKGDKIIISRRNDVIPYVESVVEHISNIKFKPPLSCPICNEELEEDDKFLTCINTECIGLRVGNLGKWVKALDVNDISDKTIDLLERAGMLTTPADFYRLDVNKISNLEGMGVRSATKIVDNFKEKSTMDLATFIDGLNINNFSKSRAETLIENGIDTLDKMFDVTFEKLITIKGIGREVANAIIFGLSQKKTVIKKLLEVVKITEKEEPEEVVMSSKKLAGKVFCFTGAINRVDENDKRFTRDMMQGLVLQNAGSVMDSVKKGLTYLVQADPSSQSTKSKKANDLGITILSEADFFKMIGM